MFLHDLTCGCGIYHQLHNGYGVDVDVVVVVDVDVDDVDDDDDDDDVSFFFPLNGIDYHDQLGVLLFIMTMGRFFTKAVEFRGYVR